MGRALVPCPNTRTDLLAVGFLIVATYLLLFLLLGSVELPLKAVVTNVLSISAAFVAVALGLERSGWLISGAAAIMVGVFVVFGVFAHMVIIKEVGIGLAIAVAVDATIVRVLLVPAVMRLLVTSAGGRRGPLRASTGVWAAVRRGNTGRWRPSGLGRSI